MLFCAKYDWFFGHVCSPTWLYVKSDEYWRVLVYQKRLPYNFSQVFLLEVAVTRIWTRWFWKRYCQKTFVRSKTAYLHAPSATSTFSFELKVSVHRNILCFVAFVQLSTFRICFKKFAMFVDLLGPKFALLHRSALWAIGRSEMFKIKHFQDFLSERFFSIGFLLSEKPFTKVMWIKAMVCSSESRFQAQTTTMSKISSDRGRICLCYFEECSGLSAFFQLLCKTKLSWLRCL